MLGMSWSEIAVILIVAIMVIRPEDIPSVLRNAGRLIGRIKKLTSELKATFDEVVEQANLKEEEGKLRKQIVDLEGKLQDTYQLDDIKPFIKESVQEEDERGGKR